MKKDIKKLLLILLVAIIVLAAMTSLTAYAEWNPIVYSVTFESNGESEVEPAQVAYGDKIIEPTAPEKVGYTFVGWYKDSSLQNRWDFDTDTVTGDITLHAKWEALSGEDPVDDTEYTVTFDSNGGNTVQTVNANYGDTIAEPTDPEKTGYTFDGWYKEIGLNNRWDFSSDTVTGNITLYAKWNPIAYTVTFNS
ncbi:MAG: InlB B-repeat-containing protein, partial [Clostridiales bacterium]|nr:InlB B-repeat-containing protein [Clostridiales bacterium]